MVMTQEITKNTPIGEEVAKFRSWFLENSGDLHPDVHFKPVSSGFNIVANRAIPANIQVVSCPFSLAITPEAAKNALSAIFQCGDAPATFTSWSERQLISSYICMHDLFDGSNLSRELAHGPYIAMLPSPDKLRTSLHFTPDEIELFRGTNVYGATFDRQKEWEAEFETCRAFVAANSPDIADRFTWESYLAAATYLSSRAFPSTLLSENPSLVSTPKSYPVLLPGVDSLNHARAHPISWTVTSSDKFSGLSIALVPHTVTLEGSELFNNYGPKPNAELIMGYGFSLPHNPDDTIVLKIGGVKTRDSRWEVGRDARGVEPVWEAVKEAVHAQNRYDVEEAERASYSVQDDLWATEVLVEMAEDLLGRLPPESSVVLNGAEQPAIRPEVAEMLDHYVEGQRDILLALITFAKRKEDAILEEARKQGIAIVDEDDDESEPEEST